MLRRTKVVSIVHKTKQTYHSAADIHDRGWRQSNTKLEQTPMDRIQKKSNHV